MAELPLGSTVQPSFAAGELATNLYGRVDLAKYHTGLALCSNFFVQPQGGVANRAGTQFCAAQRDETTAARLIPFAYSAKQTYMIEVGHQYLRFMYRGGYIVETEQLITGATQANPVRITMAGHGYSTGEDIFIVGVQGMTQLNGKTYRITKVDNDHFTLNGVDGTGYGAFTGCVGGVLTSDSTPGTGGSNAGTAPADQVGSGSGSGPGGAGYYGGDPGPIVINPQVYDYAAGIWV